MVSRSEKKLFGGDRTVVPPDKIYEANERSTTELAGPGPAKSFISAKVKSGRSKMPQHGKKILV